VLLDLFWGGLEALDRTLFEQGFLFTFQPLEEGVDGEHCLFVLLDVVQVDPLVEGRLPTLPFAELC